MKRSVMLAACVAGAAAGLCIDTREAPLAVLLAWCGDTSSPLRSVTRHWAAMPASHAFMTAASLLGPGRFSQRLGCALLMLAAMVLAGWLTPLLARATGLAPATALVITMGAGMVLAAALPMRVRPSGSPLRAPPAMP